MPTVYLAGPEVFLPDAAAIGARKKAMCAAHGMTGLFPLDADAPGATAIYAANRAMMLAADAIVANLTPFRGPNADPGTVLELGLMAGMGRCVFGYTNDPRDLLHRVPDTRRGPAGAWTDANGLAIEAFGLGENLMIEELLRAAGTPLVRAGRAPGDALRNLDGFAACLVAAARHLAA